MRSEEQVRERWCRCAAVPRAPNVATINGMLDPERKEENHRCRSVSGFA